MIPLTWNIYNRQVQRDRKYIRGDQDLRGGGNGELLLNGNRLCLGWPPKL